MPKHDRSIRRVMQTIIKSIGFKIHIEFNMAVILRKSSLDFGNLA